MNTYRKPYMDCLPVRSQGKVRDCFNGTTTPGTFLIVATDAVSTDNVTHKSFVPDKGKLLNAQSIFWMLDVLKEFPNHIIAFGKDVYTHLPHSLPYPEDLYMRGIIAKELNMTDVEFIQRKRLVGSLYSKFYSKGLPDPYGMELPPGLPLMHPFEDPLFTPTEKTDTDDGLHSKTVAYLLPEEVALTEKVYQLGFDYARDRGIEIIDTKMECGRDKDGVLYLADEWLTGDSSRFVNSGDIVLGETPPWKDKEILRQDAKRQWGDGPKVPLEFSDTILKKTSDAYYEVNEQLSGVTLKQFWRQF